MPRRRLAEYSGIHMRGLSPDDGLAADIFQPFGALFRDGTEPDDGAELELATLTPFQRVLITTDGMVTRMLEAYCLEPIDVVCLEQRVRVLPSGSQWLEVPPGTSVIVRQVLLRGHDTAIVYLYAASLLVPERLPPQMQLDLHRAGSGLGRLLARQRLENRREILFSCRRSTTALPPGLRGDLGDEVLSRTYRIIAGQKPMMLINENFPAVWTA